MKKRINENTKITLTIKQLRKLVMESDGVEWEVGKGPWYDNEFLGPVIKTMDKMIASHPTGTFSYGGIDGVSADDLREVQERLRSLWFVKGNYDGQPKGNVKEIINKIMYLSGGKINGVPSNGKWYDEYDNEHIIEKEGPLYKYGTHTSLTWKELLDIAYEEAEELTKARDVESAWRYLGHDYIPGEIQDYRRDKWYWERNGKKDIIVPTLAQYIRKKH